MSKRTMMTMDGNTAAAYTSYPFTEVAGIFPITPSSPMAEVVDEWSATGKKNLFDKPVQVIEMQSEAGAVSVVHGGLHGGALGTTYTASQGLLLMIPSMFKIAGELLPAVFHVAARAVSTHSFSIFGEQSDVMACRQTGFAILASSSVQDAMYLGAVAHLAAVKARVPFLHFFDGFRTSHEIQKIGVLSDEEAKGLLDWDAVQAFRDRAQTPNNPKAYGMVLNPDTYFQASESVTPFTDAVPGIVEAYMDKINKLTGSDYKLFNYTGAPDAERVVIAMGSACSVLEETVDSLVKQGEKVGCISVRLYRPFRADKLIEAMPKSAKKVAVLERTKERGAPGGPLYLDVAAAYLTKAEKPVLVGGRYGLGSKDFTPSMVMSVFEHLEQAEPRHDFSVGIIDDVNNSSLAPAKKPAPDAPAGITACKFWGFGSDGTVGANKSAIKIIGDHTDLYAQAYFSYDTKKSGGVTISHLRFGASPIKSSYLVDRADFIACHNPAYVGRYDLLAGLKPGGAFLLNCPWSKDELESRLPADMKRYIAANNIKFYTIDAVDIAAKLGMPGRINMVMQMAFFKVMPVIPSEEAMGYLKDAAKKAYAKQGQSVVDLNCQAIERGATDVAAIDVPAAWKDAKDASGSGDGRDMPEFVRKVVLPMAALKGDDLPVSCYQGREDGHWPTAISRFEKRGVAVNVPVWKPENCIQCNQCAMACPHACIRPMLATDAELANAPAGFQTKKASGFKDPEYQYHLAISPLDCMDCGVCVQTCPAKQKALVMEPLADQRDKAEADWNFSQASISYKPMTGQKITVKNSQFLVPYNEFSGACAGCGETPYVKLVTQLFGDRMMISNPAGCSHGWAVGSPSVSYSTDAAGHGPTWNASLFENTAEYSFGMLAAVQYERQRAVDMAHAVLAKGVNGELKDALEAWLQHAQETEGTRERAERLEKALAGVRGQDALYASLYNLREYFMKRSIWMFGGDGWAYDIGYGGLDHVLAFGQDVNVLVYDTEVYSNTGGQASKATPTGAIVQFAAGGKRARKKDLGMMAVAYGNVYVAQIGMGADRAHTLKVLQEAEAYPGMSLVIAYAPCISHGIKGGMTMSQEQTKRAVEAGYWHLWRYNPLLRDEGKNPFIMDSKEPTVPLKDFLMTEVRYSALYRKFPDRADALLDEAAQYARERYQTYQQLMK